MPAQLADYRLLALVGQGQFAQVYCAAKRSTGRLVAIKKIRHARLQPSQEQAILGQLKHPNIVGIQAIVETSSGYSLVLEYCEAGTLRSHLNTTLTPSNRLSLSETKSLISDILSGLAHIHQKGIIHGDLKPENILLTYDSKAFKRPGQLQAKISDFGSAQFILNAQADTSERDTQFVDTHLADTRQGKNNQEIGSPTYAAPERFNGVSSPVSDLYAVGVMLYELLLGDRPFSGTPETLRQAHQNQPVSLPDTLTASARQLLSTALHKDPRQRFQTASDMRQQLNQLSAIFLTPQKEKNTTVPVSTFPQSLIPIPSNGITAPIESLIKIPQGCCIITAHSLHVLTRKRKLMSMARFEQPCWISVSPDGRWFSALPKQENPEAPQRDTQGMIGELSHRSGHQWRRSIQLTSRLLTALQTDIVQVIAIDSRHLVRIRRVQSSAKTIFEFFTRTGTFVGELFLNLPLTQAAPTAEPYQLIALSASTEHTPATTVLITLNPFQTKQIRLPFTPEKVCALPWGYMAFSQRKALFLDRSIQPLSWLHGAPSVQFLSAIDGHKILLSVAKPSLKLSKTTDGKHNSADDDTAKKSTPTNRMPESSLLPEKVIADPGPREEKSTKKAPYIDRSSLLMTDLNSLDLGLIF